MERIYITDLLETLRYRDLRSVRRWCANNQVRVLSDIGSKWRFVMKEELERALIRFHEESKKESVRTKHVKIGRYTPVGETEKTFLSTLQII